MVKVKFIEWQEDKWLSREGSVLPFDKIEHFLLGIILALAILLVFSAHTPEYPVGKATIWDFLWFSFFAVGWEIKDGLVPLKSGRVQGFSWKDLIADYAGFLVVFFTLWKLGLYHAF